MLALPAALTWRVEADAIPYIVASGALELVYFAMLAAAYRRYELSLVYPVARGLAPVLALLIVVAAGGALPATLGMVGVLVVSAGVLLVRGPRGDLHGLAVGRRSPRSSPATRSSTATASSTRPPGRTCC